MRKNSLLLVVCPLLIVLAGGCASDGAKTDSATPPPAADKMSSSLAADLAKCDQCGKEVTQTDLAPHDGKMWCKDCMASHSHG